MPAYYGSFPSGSGSISAIRGNFRYNQIITICNDNKLKVSGQGSKKGKQKLRRETKQHRQKAKQQKKKRKKKRMLEKQGQKMSGSD